MSTATYNEKSASKPDPKDAALHWRREKRIGTTQLILSAAMLALVLIVYMFKPSVGLGATGVEPGSHLASASWASVLEEAQALRMTILSAEFERVPTETAERWATRAEQLAVTIRTAAGAEETAALGLSTDEVVSRAGGLTSIDPVRATPAVLTHLNEVIPELETLADSERVSRLALLQEASASAVRDLAARNLLIAANGLTAALALIGLGMGLDRLTTADRHLVNLPVDGAEPDGAEIVRRHRVVMDEARLAAS